MNEEIATGTKQELLDKMQVIQEAVNQRYQEAFNRYKAWFLKRRQKVLDEVTAHRRPGILDRISTCESREAAHLMWHEFLDSANSVSQKTINKANRLLAILDFPLP